MNPADPSTPATTALETITLGGGCFWCTEAVFREVAGVASVESGYSNGRVARPTYEDVCTGNTGCVEVVQLQFDLRQIGLADVLRIFFATHDPTTLNRQGADIGTQYRSGIYWSRPEQAEVAAAVIAEAAAAFAPRAIVTEVQPLRDYTGAEGYHQRYYELHPRQGYCAHVIAPKLEKFRAAFARHRKA